MARHSLLGAGSSAMIVARTSREQKTNSRKTNKSKPGCIRQKGKFSFQEAAIHFCLIQDAMNTNEKKFRTQQ
jgi:hypothetical protein